MEERVADEDERGVGAIERWVKAVREGVVEHREEHEREEEEKRLSTRQSLVAWLACADVQRVRETAMHCDRHEAIQRSESKTARGDERKSARVSSSCGTSTAASTAARAMRSLRRIQMPHSEPPSRPSLPKEKTNESHPT